MSKGTSKRHVIGSGSCWKTSDGVSLIYAPVSSRGGDWPKRKSIIDSSAIGRQMWADGWTVQDRTVCWYLFIAHFIVSWNKLEMRAIDWWDYRFQSTVHCNIVVISAISSSFIDPSHHPVYRRREGPTTPISRCPFFTQSNSLWLRMTLYWVMLIGSLKFFVIRLFKFYVILSLALLFCLFWRNLIDVFNVICHHNSLKLLTLGVFKTKGDTLS